MVLLPPGWGNYGTGAAPVVTEVAKSRSFNGGSGDQTLTFEAVKGDQAEQGLSNLK